MDPKESQELLGPRGLAGLAGAIGALGPEGLAGALGPQGLAGACRSRRLAQSGPLGPKDWQDLQEQWRSRTEQDHAGPTGSKQGNEDHGDQQDQQVEF